MASIEKKLKNLLWIQGLTCNGNSHSFLSAEETFFESFLNNIDILYHPTLTVEKNFVEILNDIKLQKKELDFLIVEGSIGLRKGKVFFQGIDVFDLLNDLKDKSNFIIAIGNCAVFGNFPALNDEEISGLQFRFKENIAFFDKDFKTKSGYPVINISGCPAHPEWIIRTILTLNAGFEIKLDNLNRPKDFYMYLAHNGCIRNEYFEWKVEAHEFGTKEGCLFYELGCRGPLTHSPCNKILWNGKSSKTRSGMPCIGCTEFDFPLRSKYFETKTNIGIPEEVPLGVSKRAYIMLSGVAKTFTNQRLNKKLEETDI